MSVAERFLDDGVRKGDRVCLGPEARLQTTVQVQA